MTLKTLHFLCRSLGFDQNPPVAIDGKVMVQRVWPLFLNAGLTNNLRPGNWRESGYPFEAYSRYMTAIRTWAHQRQWTTTQTETTIFAAFGQQDAEL